MKKTVRLNDIAEAADLSLNTVSRILRGKTGYTENTRTKVLKIAEEYGYIKKNNDRSIISGTVGIVSTKYNSADPYFYVHLLRKVEHLLNIHRYNIMLFNNLELFNIDFLKSSAKLYNLKGILILGDVDEFVLKAIKATGIHCVGVSFTSPLLYIPSVEEDNFSGLFQTVQYLKKTGYKKIGFIGSVIKPMSFAQRYMGFVGALEHYDLEYVRDYIYLYKEERADINFLSEKLNKAKKLPEVFICANDEIARIMCRLLSEKGFSVPDDIGITGFDNNELAVGDTPLLTTVDSFRDKQAKRSVDILLHNIETKSNRHERIVLPVELVVRESTRNPSRSTK